MAFTWQYIQISRTCNLKLTQCRMSIIYQIKNCNTFLCGKTCQSQENQHKTTTQLCLGSDILTVSKGTNQIYILLVIFWPQHLSSKPSMENPLWREWDFQAVIIEMALKLFLKNLILSIIFIQSEDKRLKSELGKDPLFW